MYGRLKANVVATQVNQYSNPNQINSNGINEAAGAGNGG